jgi:hypothetical protein
MGRQPGVEPLNTLDEKFIASPVAFEVMRPTTAVIVDGAPLRTADGTLDRDLIRAVVLSVLPDVPEFRQSLRNAWLGLATPVWMAPRPASEIDLLYHVRFHPEKIDLPASWDLLTGRHSGPMERSRPLWDLLVTDIDDGRIGLALRGHHVIGDGVFLMRAIEGFFGTRRRQATAAGGSNADLTRAPLTSLGVLFASARAYASHQKSLADAWQEYWRKPVLDRVRRWGGRILRPARYARFARAAASGAARLPALQSRSRTVGLAVVRERAKEMGGSLTAVTVAAALRAASAATGREEVAMLVPISSPTRGVGSKRNDVSVARVALKAGTPIAEAVASVTDQIGRAVETGASGAAPRSRDWVGYASYLPLRRPARAFGPARVESLTLWPVVEPVDDIGVFACSNLDGFTVGVTARQGIDVDVVMNAVLADLGVDQEAASWQS